MNIWCLIVTVLTILSLRGVSSSVVSLNGMVHHFEPLVYNAQELLHHHTTKRDLDKSQIKLPFVFQAFGRRFDIELFPDDSMFSPDVKISDGINEYDFDRSKLYSGRSRTSQPMYITGHLYHDVFTGVIVTETETYVIEPADRHFNTSQSYHSIIYKESDVMDVNGKMCGVSDEKVVETDANELPTLSSMFSDGMRVRRQSVNMGKRTCTLLVDLENKFVDSVKGSVTDVNQIRAIAMGQVAIHLSLVSSIFSGTEFPQLFDDDLGVFLIVPKVIINLDTETLFADNFIGVAEYLNIFSGINHDDYCLACKFTHRDFEGGVLGLAWVGSTSFGSGGICDPFTGTRGLNTGIVTTLNYGRTVSVITTTITWAHEMGHNFGAPHDTTAACTGQPVGNNYIMYPQANDGSQPNNILFSSCSIASMTTIIEAKGANEDGCFQARVGVAFCGNGIVEEGEQCDCGFAADCSDNCCDAGSCTLMGVECSPTEGPCCFTNCTYNPFGTECMSEAECTFLSVCTGVNATCPTPAPKVNNTLCNNNQSVCFNGECSSSYCLFNGLFDCDIISQDSLLVCELACTNDTSPDGICVSTYEIALMNGSTIEGRQQVVGGLCNGTEGYCDYFSVCRSPDDEGPLTRLTNLILNPETLQSIQEYLTTYWWKKRREDLGPVTKKKKSGLVLRNPNH
ncbi:ADAM10 [Oopsacas minuta]|uniref:ADAM10 endopeptidase n=1 Tax=Oopsacas minuta TaxID=111878 RepID=A0AAV7K9K6_9METZ|nr:ADAM10 [Oopsacas minuta]